MIVNNHHYRYIFTLLIVLLAGANAYSQIGRVPLKGGTESGRVMAEPGDTLHLPFWDDFSDASYAPDPVRWPENRGVLIGNDLGINLPTIGAATFDGVDITGRPYNVTSTVATGLADTLVSAPLDLAAVPPADRSTVYLNFYVQFEGLGENPDASDSLYLQFYNASGEWEVIWTSNELQDVTNDEFQQIIIAVDQERWFHAGFRMQFASTGRLSGGFDTWQLDYVFLGPDRSAGQTSFEDRALSTFPETIFGDYYAVPVPQFIANPSAYIQAESPSVLIRNLDDTDQPVRIAASIVNGEMPSDVIQVMNDGLEGDGETVFAGQTREFASDPVNYDLILDRLDADRDGVADEDSLRLELDLVFTINSGDSVLYSINKPDSAIVDFAANDTARTTLVLDNYFAYDDGTAEFGLSVKGRAARFAYRFVLQTPAILEGVEVMFPNLGRVQSGTTLDFMAWDTLAQNFNEYLVLTTRAITGTDSVNKFVYYQFDKPVQVQDTVYVGWQQNTDQPVVVGLDRSGDTSDRMFVNLGSEWLPVTDPEVQGNLLLRPVFRTAVVSGVPERPYEGTLPYAYPNPASSRAALSGDWMEAEVYSLAGKKLSAMNRNVNGDFIQTEALPDGLYLIVFYDRNGTTYTHKLIVKH